MHGKASRYVVCSRVSTAVYKYYAHRKLVWKLSSFLNNFKSGSHKLATSYVPYRNDIMHYYPSVWVFLVSREGMLLILLAIGQSTLATTGTVWAVDKWPIWL